MVNNRDGGSNPLAYVAIRVLSQTTSSSQCERNWSTFSLIHSKIRNRLKAERLEKLVYCHYNMRLRLRNIKRRQQLRQKRALQLGGHVQTEELTDTTGQIDMDVLFDDDHPLHSWVEVRAGIDEPLFDPDDTTWAEGILDGAVARDPELRSSKRPREGGEGSSRTTHQRDPSPMPPTIEVEPARKSESDSRPVTPRMVGPPTFLRRTTSQVQRTDTAAREDPEIEKMKQIYVRHTPRGKGLVLRRAEEKEREKKAAEEEKKQRRKLVKRNLLVSYDDDDDDDDDDSSDDDAAAAAAGAAVGTTGTGFTAPSFSLHVETGTEHSQGHEGHEQGYHGQDSGYRGGQHHAGMYDTGSDYEAFEFGTHNIYGSSSSFPQDVASSDSGFQSSQQPYTPRGIQMSIEDFGTSLFGYPAYREYMQPYYRQEKEEDESEASSSHYRY